MNIEPSTSLLTAEEIKKYIEKKYSPKSYNINFYNGPSEIDIYIILQIKEGGYDVDIPIRFVKEDINKIVVQILKEKNIDFMEDSFFTSIKKGIATERSDSEFLGIKFRWNEKFIADKISQLISG